MAKISLGAAVGGEGVHGDQPYRMLLDCIVDESAIGHHVTVAGEGPHHSLAAVAVAGDDVEGRLQRCKERLGMGKFRRLAVLGHIAGVYDGVGHGVEVVDVGDALAKVLRPRAEHRVRRVGGREVGVGDLSDDHGLGSRLPARSSDADRVTGIGKKTPPRVRVSRQTPFQSALPMKPSRGTFFRTAARWASSA